MTHEMHSAASHMQCIPRMVFARRSVPICGVLCEAHVVTDLVSTRLYKTKRCTIVVGDLYILNLPFEVTRTLLLDALKSIKVIRGTLHFENNIFSASMIFFDNLVEVQRIVLVNNPQLIDARFKSLRLLHGGVSVEGSPQLCPERYRMHERQRQRMHELARCVHLASDG
jgi:hypothetical protein